jgi:N-acetylglucosamine-6-sulfatase
VISAKAVDLIRTAPADQPLFLWVAPNAPHVPTWQVAPRYNAPCDVPRWKPPNYDEFNVIDKPLYIRRRLQIGGKGKKLGMICRQLLAVDDLVGAVRGELAAHGRLENTIIVYAGDDGYFQGEHRIGSGKGAPYVTDVPFAMARPAGLGTEPRTIGERLQNIHFAPTICALAGCSLGPYPNGQTRPDGLSFAPLLLGTATTVGRDAVLEEMLNAVPPVSTPYAALVTTDLSPLGRWHYVEYSNGERELYDISNGPCWAWRRGLLPGDPCELINQVNYPKNASLVRALHLRLRELEHEKGGPGTGAE